MAAQQTQSIAMSSDKVMALAFSQDGNFLAAGCMDSKVRLWDMRNNSLFRTLEAARRAVRTVSFSPDCKIVAAGSDDRVVYLWETATGKQKHSLKDNCGPVNAVAFSPDGTLLASGAFDWTAKKDEKALAEVKLWNANTGELHKTLVQTEGYVWRVKFFPDGKSLAIAIAPWNLQNTFSGALICDVTTGQERRRMVWDGGFPLSLSMSGDGKLLACGGGYAVPTDNGSTLFGEAKLWDAGNGKLLWTLKSEHGDYFRSIALAPDGKTLITGGQGPLRDYNVGNARGQKVVSEAALWDIDTRRTLWKTEGELGSVHALAISPDGTTVAGADDANLKLCDAKSGLVREVLMTWTFKPIK
jgi:WD40 repeat protein